jgi:hypothetical protein
LPGPRSRASIRPGSKSASRDQVARPHPTWRCQRRSPGPRATDSAISHLRIGAGAMWLSRVTGGSQPAHIEREARMLDYGAWRGYCYRSQFVFASVHRCVHGATSVVSLSSGQLGRGTRGGNSQARTLHPPATCRRGGADQRGHRPSHAQRVRGGPARGSMSAWPLSRQPTCKMTTSRTSPRG